MKNVWTIFKRELGSYFSHPIAYAVIVVFLLLSTLFAFTLGSFMDAQDASLTYSFFAYLPFVLMVLVPAVGMRLLSEEQRSGTIELNGKALPGQVIVRDFLGRRMSTAFLAFCESWILPAP